MEPAIKKIVAIGPESTGKSTICTQLAVHFGTRWVPEFAREYLLKHGNQYTYPDLYTIGKGQLQIEDDVIGQMQADQNLIGNKAHPLFIDTDLYVIKVWGEFVFDNCDNRILNEIVRRSYDLYLLCNPDLPWEKDELREYPDYASRERLYHYYKDLLVNQEVPWLEIKGNHQQRLQTAIEAVNALL